MSLSVVIHDMFLLDARHGSNLNGNQGEAIALFLFADETRPRPGYMPHATGQLLYWQQRFQPVPADVFMRARSSCSAAAIVEGVSCSAHVAVEPVSMYGGLN
jgi:hypothetical protein